MTRPPKGIASVEPLTHMLSNMLTQGHALNQHKLKKDFIANTFLKSETNKQLFLHLTHLSFLPPTFLNILYLEFNIMGLKKKCK